MLKSVRCKLSVAYVEPGYGNKGTKVRMNGVWEGSTDKQLASENRIFGEATPAANLDMVIQNKPAGDFFVLGQHYYLDFVLCSEVTLDQIERAQKSLQQAQQSLAYYTSELEKGSTADAHEGYARAMRTLVTQEMQLEGLRRLHAEQHPPE